MLRLIRVRLGRRSPGPGPAAVAAERSTLRVVATGSLGVDIRAAESLMQLLAFLPSRACPPAHSGAAGVHGSSARSGASKVLSGTMLLAAQNAVRFAVSSLCCQVPVAQLLS